MQYQNRTPRTLMKRVSVILLGLALVVPAVAFAADLTAEQILAKVSQTYGGLRSFRFEEQESQPPFNISGILGPQDLPAPFGDRPARCETDLAVSTPGKIRLVVSSREAKILLVSDGRKTWEYIPDLNEYTGGRRCAAASGAVGAPHHPDQRRPRPVQEPVSRGATREAARRGNVEPRRAESAVLRCGRPSPRRLAEALG